LATVPPAAARGALSVRVADEELPRAKPWRSKLNAARLDTHYVDSDYPYDDECMSCKKTYSTLRLFSDTLTPARISSALGLEPTQSLVKGEPISAHVPRARTQHGWLLCTEHRVFSRDTRRHIDWLLEGLGSRPESLALLRSDEVSADIFTYWVSARGQGGPILSPPQLTKLAHFGLECIFDIYSAPNDEEQT